MKRQSLQHVLLLAATAGVAMTSAVANANPVAGQFTNDSRGDAIADLMLNREIGDSALFPIPDGILYHDHRAIQTVGVADDGIANDWLVHITNITGQSFGNLFFVADVGATIGNADGTIADTIGAPGVPTDAFHIDALGTNPNLIMESISPDGIFQPGEQWEFVVTNFNTGTQSFAPTLISPGEFSGSSPLGGLGGTNASILATVVPEPSTLSIVALMALSALRRRRRERLIKNINN